jgi:hypothetical protein
MDELLKYYRSMGQLVPLDVQVEAVETYGFIIETNYPQEDYLYVERLFENCYPIGYSDISTSYTA